MSSALLNTGRAFALSAAGILSGCVMVIPIPIPPTASARFQACAEENLDRFTGAGTSSVSSANVVSQNGWTLTQSPNGSVRVNTPNVPTAQKPALEATANTLLASVMDCK